MQKRSDVPGEHLSMATGAVCWVNNQQQLAAFPPLQRRQRRFGSIDPQFFSLFLLFLFFLFPPLPFSLSSFHRNCRLYFDVDFFEWSVELKKNKDEVVKRSPETTIKR